MYDVADGLQTLRQEHARDGLPWNVREHANPFGDYSLTLLQWLLQRRLVCKPADQQFASTNLIESCSDEMLLAEDLVGGLVHCPSTEDPSHGHWVAFASKPTTTTFWWMDSLHGFELVSTPALQARLAGLRFAVCSAEIKSF